MFNRSVSLLVLCLGVTAQADNVGDRFKDYVNRTIPITHEIAKAAAAAKEMGAFVNRASLAQSHLAQASKWALMIEKFLPTVKPEAGFCTTDARGLVDVRQVMTQASTLYEALNSVLKVRESVADFRRVATAVETACDADAAFAAYDIKELGFSFYFPEKPELMDGIYLVWTSGGGPGAQQDNGKQKEAGEQFFDFLSVLPFVGSVVRVFRNNGIRVSIDADTARLAKEVAQTGNYIAYAKESCRTTYTENKKVYEDYQAMATSLSKFADSIPVDEIKNRVKALQNCVKRYPEQLKVLLQQEADAVAQRKFGQPINEARFMARRPNLLAEIQTALPKLDGPHSLACGEGATIREWLERVLVGANISGAAAHSALVQARSVLAKRTAVCGVEE
jgi:hypothetical protein